MEGRPNVIPRSFRVESEGSGQRLDVWLSSASGRSRSEVQRLIDGGSVRVGGTAASSKSMRVHRGELVEILDLSAVPPAPEAAEFEVRFEDEHLAVVFKPAGVVVHPAPGTRSGTLVEALARRMPLAPAAGEGRPGVVHRLDKTTSGLLVFAKTDSAYHALVSMMRARKVERTYLALVAGKFRMPAGRIEAPVGRPPGKWGRMGVTTEGREAITSFQVLEEIEDVSLIEVRLHTGRTHQIRVHFAHIGHPVVGDSVYGRRASNIAKRIGLARSFLHAASLKFEHPIEGGGVEVEEKLPKDLAEALERARKAAP